MTRQICEWLYLFLNNLIKSQILTSVKMKISLIYKDQHPALHAELKYSQMLVAPRVCQVASRNMLDTLLKTHGHPLLMQKSSNLSNGSFSHRLLRQKLMITTMLDLASLVTIEQHLPPVPGRRSILWRSPNICALRKNLLITVYMEWVRPLFSIEIQ